MPSSSSSSSSRKLVLLSLVVIILASVLVYKYFTLSGSSGPRGSQKSNNMETPSPAVLQMSAMDVLAGETPKKATDDIEVQEKSVTVKVSWLTPPLIYAPMDHELHKLQGVKIFYREATPLGPHPHHQQVLLLHGQAFTSQNWLTLGTLSSLAAWGHRAVGVDLPGFGKSDPAPSSISADPGGFLSNLIDALKLLSGGGVVIISPSMSGKFSLPFLVLHPEKVKGYVPVAPVATESYADRFPSIHVRS